jgi:hypothetical protein
MFLPIPDPDLTRSDQTQIQIVLRASIIKSYYNFFY